MKIMKIINYLQTKYPQEFASSFDIGKIGLQFGSPSSDVKKIMIALDGSSDVIEEAIEKGVDLLITHHPFMFNPMLSMNYDSPFGKKMLKVFENRLNVYAMHTNFDVANGGMNDILSKMLDLEHIHAHKDEIDATCFLRIGEIKEMNLASFSKYVVDKLHLDGARVIGNPDKMIKKVGIVGGGGSSDMFNAIRHNCDCFITGEMRHNNALDAIENDICIVEVNHDVEANFKKYLKEELSYVFKDDDVEILISEVEKSPFWRI